MPTTHDRNDPRVKPYTGPDQPAPQDEVYLVLSEAERAKGFVRPLRHSYIHTKCGTQTTMGLALCETYARNPKFYGATYTYCVGCCGHFPVGEFTWDEDGKVVGS